MDYLVTIGIPVYNVQNHIRTSLESALAQTFDRIEYLLIDDCGTDRSVDIVKELQLTHPRGEHIHMIHQPHNMGPGVARNTMIERAAGKYIYFMDADDTIEPDTIKILYNASTKHHADVCFGSYNQIKAFNDNTECIEHKYPDRLFSNNDEFGHFVFRKYDGIQTPVWNCLIDVDFLRRTNLRFLPVYFWEDMAMMLQLPAYVTKAVTMSCITYHYYCHYDSLSNFQKRDVIEKSEIETTINTIEQVKQRTKKFIGKSYYSKMLNKIMMTDFYMACNILHNKREITPSFSASEIKAIMRYPLSLMQILCLRPMIVMNLGVYILGLLPASWSVFVIDYLGKKKSLI
jgi:glycosyltransferase involved in cell wall biosynthesis